MYEYEDGRRVCVECGDDFIIWGHEREFFEKRQLQLPKRCKKCRASRRQEAQTESWRRGA